MVVYFLSIALADLVSIGAPSAKHLEHGVVEFSENSLKNVCVMKAGSLMRLFFTPYWMSYHLASPRDAYCLPQTFKTT